MYRRLQTGPSLSLVGLDGRPGVLASAEFYSDAGNDLALEEDRRNFLATFEASVQAVRASTPEVDVLAGLDKAAGAARATAGAGTVVVVDSGLSTAGPLDFGVPHVLGAHPDEMINFLRAHGCPTMTLSASCLTKRSSVTRRVRARCSSRSRSYWPTTAPAE